MLNARSLKVTIAVDPAEVLRLAAPEGKSFKTSVLVDGKAIELPLNGRGVRKAISTVRELGVGNVTVLIVGRLRLGSPPTLEEAGIVAQAKVVSQPKVKAAA